VNTQLMASVETTRQRDSRGPCALPAATLAFLVSRRWLSLARTVESVDQDADRRATNPAQGHGVDSPRPGIEQTSGGQGMAGKVAS